MLQFAAFLGVVLVTRPTSHVKAPATSPRSPRRAPRRASPLSAHGCGCCPALGASTSGWTLLSMQSEQPLLKNTTDTTFISACTTTCQVSLSGLAIIAWQLGWRATVAVRACSPRAQEFEFPAIRRASSAQRLSASAIFRVTRKATSVRQLIRLQTCIVTCSSCLHQSQIATQRNANTARAMNKVACMWKDEDDDCVYSC